MVTETIIHLCRRYGSPSIVKNCHNASGKRGVFKPCWGYSEEPKEQILAAYYERPSMIGIERIFEVSCHTLADWLGKKTAQTHQ